MPQEIRFRKPPEVGQAIEVRLEDIRNRAGALSDPDTVTGKLQDPSGNETVYVYNTDAELVKEETGAYYFLFTPDEAGYWYARIETVNPAVAHEVRFKVDDTVFTYS